MLSFLGKGSKHRIWLSMHSGKGNGEKIMYYSDCGSEEHTIKNMHKTDWKIYWDVAVRNTWAWKFRGCYLVSVSEVSIWGTVFDTVSLDLWQGWTCDWNPHPQSNQELRQRECPGTNSKWYCNNILPSVRPASQ